MEMCVVYLILDSVAALATTVRRPPQYLRVFDNISIVVDQCLVRSWDRAFGFGLVLGWGIFRYRPCFTLPSDLAIVWEWLLSCRV